MSNYLDEIVTTEKTSTRAIPTAIFSSLIRGMADGQDFDEYIMA